jgi:hypothetical protein
MSTVSEKLLKTLVKGKRQLSEEALARVRDFVMSQKTDEDVFMNKNRTADLYYTVVGWLLAYMLDIRLDEKKTSAYLKRQAIDGLDFIHYAAFVRCRLLQKLLAGRYFALGMGRLFSSPVKPLYAFEHYPHDDAETPYSRFVWLCMMEDANRKIRNKAELKAGLNEYRVPTGGFSNRKNNPAAATNATAAALAGLGPLAGYKTNEDVHFLQELQKVSGGFAAAPHSPVPDLLSTATALFTLQCYRIKPKISPCDFIEAHWLNSGGFSATLLEDTSDVEYTFYGLLALGTL